MTSALCATVLCSGLLLAGVDNAATAPNDESYATAHKTTVETGKPLLVMVGTDWCGPCQNMKRNVLPLLRKRGFFKKVAFALVNADREAKLAKELTGGGAVPQLVLYRKTSKGWMRRILIGGQSEETVEQFINDALSADKAEKEKESNAQEQS